MTTDTTEAPAFDFEAFQEIFPVYCGHSTPKMSEAEEDSFFSNAIQALKDTTRDDRERRHILQCFGEQLNGFPMPERHKHEFATYMMDNLDQPVLEALRSTAFHYGLALYFAHDDTGANPYMRGYGWNEQSLRKVINVAITEMAETHGDKRNLLHFLTKAEERRELKQLDKIKLARAAVTFMQGDPDFRELQRVINYYDGRIFKEEGSETDAASTVFIDGIVAELIERRSILNSTAGTPVAMFYAKLGAYKIYPRPFIEGRPDARLPRRAMPHPAHG